MPDDVTTTDAEVNPPPRPLSGAGASAAAGATSRGAPQAQASRSALERVLAWFGEGEDWQRPAPTAEERRRDIALAVFLAALAAVSLELLRSLGMMTGSEYSVVQQHAMLVSGFVPLVWRRRFPVVVAIISQVHFMVVGLVLPVVSTTLVLQAIYVVSIYTAVAWARDRSVAAGFSAAMVLYIGIWLAWSFATGNATDAFMQQIADRDRGLIGPVAAAMTYMTLMNAVILAFGIVVGRNSWWAARDRAALAEQTETVARQAGELRSQAVIGERLRIARELHDVVAHHIAVTGVQAAAARKALDKAPELAETALGHVEEASRTAVFEMRSLLGTLREGNGPIGPAGEEGGRTREPTLTALPELVDGYRGAGLEVGLDLVGGDEHTLGQVSTAPGLAAYRIVQEALTNVTRHSTATKAHVVVRFLGDQDAVQEGAGGPALLEVEITDNGRPRGGTSGTGLGQLGMRERVQVAGGEFEAGPRAVGGYRVRARLPLRGRWDSHPAT